MWSFSGLSSLAKQALDSVENGIEGVRKAGEGLIERVDGEAEQGDAEDGNGWEDSTLDIDGADGVAATASPPKDDNTSGSAAKASPEPANTSGFGVFGNALSFLNGDDAGSDDDGQPVASSFSSLLNSAVSKVIAPADEAEDAKSTATADESSDGVELAALQATLASKDHVIAELTSKLAVLEGENAAKARHIAEIESEHEQQSSALLSQLKLAVAETADARQQMQQVQALYDAVVSRADAADELVADLQGQLAEAQAAVQQLQQSQSTASDSQSQLQELQAQLNDVIAERDQLRRANATLSQQLSACHQLGAEANAASQAQLGELQAQLSQFRDSEAQLTAERDAAADKLTRDVAQLQAQLDSERAENAAAVDTLSRSHADAIAALQSDMQRLTTELQASVCARDAVAAELAAQTDVNADLSQLLQQAQDQLASQQAQYTHSLAERDQRIDAMLAENAALKGAVTALEAAAAAAATDSHSRRHAIPSHLINPSEVPHCLCAHLCDVMGV